MIGSSRARLALLLSLVVVPTLARAEPPPPPTEEQVEVARGIYREAKELYKQGKLQEAIARALEAYRTAATPVTALEAGQMLVEAGRLVEARDLARGVALLPASPRESDKGREARQEAVTLATSLDARIPKIALAGRPAGALVLLDGKPLPPGDENAWQGTDPGSHTVAVRSGERTCASMAFALAEREERTIDLHGSLALCAAPVPSASASSSSVVLSTPPPPDDGPRWGAVVVLGVGVLGVAAGGVLALTAKSDYDSVAASCPVKGCTQDAYDTRNSARSRADVATVIMIAGGAAAAAGAVWFFWPRAGATSARVGVSAGQIRFAVPF